MTLATSCRSCSGGDLTRVYEVFGVPVENSRLHDTAESARATPRGDLVLDRCERCGFVQNSAFDASLVPYDDQYEDSQAHSAFFRAFADRIITELIDTYDLHGKRALEIGCGRGDFLRDFCAASGGPGVGLDPSATREAGVAGDVEIRADAFGPGSGHSDADVIICRHTLEHIPDVAAFMTTLRAEFDDRPEAVLYLEIPDTGRIADEGAFWDLYYEHCAYFDREAICDLLRRTGWKVLECRLDYGDQYIVVHARPGAPHSAIDRGAEAMDFGQISASTARWRAWATDIARGRSRLALWAATSKTVGFLTVADSVDPVVIVDMNPAKWGKYLPASGLIVCAPDSLASWDVDEVLVMNPLYVSEIGAELRSMGIDAGVSALG